MYGRPVDDNERRYLRASWRVLRIANRMRLVSFVFACLGGLVIVGGAVLLARKDGHHVDGMIGAVIIGVLGLAITATYGFLARLGLRASGARFPDRPLVEDIEGPFRIQSTRARLFFWLGDRLVTLPGHWLGPIERAGEQQIFRAEAVQGPMGEMMILTLGDRLSVSRDIALGMGTGGSLRLLLPAFSALCAFLAGELIVHNLGDSDLTLRRYLTVGRNPMHFASMAEFARVRPPPYTPVDIGDVTLACGTGNRVFAVDGAPDGWQDQGRRLRAEAEALMRPLADVERMRSHPDLEASVAAQAARLFADAGDWVRRLEKDAVRRGLRLAGARSHVASLREALDHVAAFVHRDLGIAPPYGLEDILRDFTQTMPAAIALKSVPRVTGVLYPLSGDDVTLVTGKSYSPDTAILGAIVDGIGMLAAGLIVATVLAVRRRRPIRRRLMAALPDVA